MCFAGECNLTFPPQQRFGEKGKQNLLPKAETLLKATLLANKMELIRMEPKIKDRYGTYAEAGKVKTPLGEWNFILIAREYFYGQFVGCGRYIMSRALKEGRKLLIYVEDKSSIFVYDPYEVYESEGIQVSMRNGMQEYYDFKWNLGKKLTIWIADYIKRIEDVHQTKIPEYTEVSK